MNYFNYKRRQAHKVQIGNIALGSDYPVLVQTMTSTDTLDTEASVAQCERIIKAGGELIRLTAQGVKHSENLKIFTKPCATKVTMYPCQPTSISIPKQLLLPPSM